MAKRLSAAGALTGAEGSDPGFAASRSPWLLSTKAGRSDTIAGASGYTNTGHSAHRVPSIVAALKGEVQQAKARRRNRSYIHRRRAKLE